jgi:glycosyltransferase involved in cell wall biosynthesis
LKVLLIIPSYNEANNLAPLVNEIKALNLGYDIIVIDDASIDNSSDIARAMNIPVISLATNLGIGGAVQTGFKYAIRNGYDIVVQVDGDGQHNPVWLPTIIEPIREGKADCVIGSRYCRIDPDINYKTPFLRRVGMYFSSGVLFITTGLWISDTTSGFRALSRKVVEFFASDYPIDHPEAESLLLLHQKGFVIIERPVTMRGRTSGQSLFTSVRAILYPVRVVLGFIGLIFKVPGRK